MLDSGKSQKNKYELLSALSHSPNQTGYQADLVEQKQNFIAVIVVFCDYLFLIICIGGYFPERVAAQNISITLFKLTKRETLSTSNKKKKIRTNKYSENSFTIYLFFRAQVFIILHFVGSSGFSFGLCVACFNEISNVVNPRL